VLFYRANIVVDAVFDKLTVMSRRNCAIGSRITAAERRRPQSANLPTTCQGLPTHKPFEFNAIRGRPRGASEKSEPVTAELVGFPPAGAESWFASNRTDPEEATLR